MFIKDELRGDGTSGRDDLTQKDMVLNSEEVTLETRDRFRSEVIIETETLQHHTDYDIGYDTARASSRVRLPSRDKNFNPTYIVVRYETKDLNGENFNYRGRATVKVLNQKIELGASYVHEERCVGDGDLYGADPTIKLTPRTTLKFEAAHTDSEFDNEDCDDNAYLTDLRHKGNRLKP